MSLLYNTVKVRKMLYNGISLSEVWYNGVLIWPDMDPIMMLDQFIKNFTKNTLL